MARGKQIIRLQEMEITQTTVCTKMRQLRAFLYFCMEREYVPSFKIVLLVISKIMISN